MSNQRSRGRPSNQRQDNVFPGGSGAPPPPQGAWAPKPAQQQQPQPQGAWAPRQQPVGPPPGAWPQPQQQGPPPQGAWAPQQHTQGPPPGVGNRPQTGGPAQGSRPQGGGPPQGNRGPPQGNQGPSQGNRGPPQGSQPANGHQGGGDQGQGAIRRPPSQTAPIEQGMRQMSVRGDSGRAKRPAFERYDCVKTRPETAATKRGKEGTVVKLKSNYYKINKLIKDWAIYSYHVDFKPDIDATVVRKAILRNYANIFGTYLFQGMQLYTMKKLPNEVTEFTASRLDGSQVVITVKYTGYVESIEPVFLSILNSLFRRCFDGLKLQLIGRNYFDMDNRDEIPEYKIQILQGFKNSIRQHEDDLLLCLDMASRVLRNQTAWEIIQEHIHNRNRNANYQQAVMTSLIGVTVLTRYNNKTYQVCDVDFNSNPNSTFLTKAGEISFAEYYKQHYNITIRDKGQPLLVSKSKDRDKRAGKEDVIKLIPEICFVTGITDQMRKDFKQMKAISNYTLAPPRRRITCLNRLNDRLRDVKGIPADILKQWSLSLEQNMVEIDGRILPAENVRFDGAAYVARPATKVDWDQALINNKMFLRKELKNWVVICPRDFHRETQEHVALLKQAVGRKMGMLISEPQYLTTNRDDEIHRQLKEAQNKDPALIMIVVSSQNANTYAQIKKFCVMEFPVPSQVVTKKCIMRRAISVATKIGVQINCKLGGAPWNLNSIADTMIVGFDVCHDTVRKTNSFGALVATIDPEKGIYFSTVSEHKEGEELSRNLALQLVAAIREYARIRASYPKRIIFYRDGVGDGQLEYVHKVEVNGILEVLKNASANVNISLVFVVVTKRINTRIFTQRDENPFSGTIVDSVITQPERYDFYLVSQNADQGTVNPTSYNVIFDNMKISPDRIQGLTYRLTHMYFNYAAPIRVPSVCQLAHKLAFLCGQFVHASPNYSRLTNSLYFL